MFYVVMLTVNGTFGRIPQKHSITEYEELRGYIELLPCPYEWFELVRVEIGEYKYIIVLDESGLLKDFQINQNASRLYGGSNDFIVGDVLVFSDHGDEEMYAMTEEECDVLERAVSSSYTIGHNENETAVVI